MFLSYLPLDKLALGTAALAILAGCGQQGEAAPRRAEGGQVQTAGIALPVQILGLEVKVEDVEEKLGEAQRPFIDSIGLFSFRENDLVRATFQVSRFNRLADPDDARFRGSIIDLLGRTQPLRMRLGGDTIYTTTGNEQNIYAWFEGRGFFVLTAHRDYEFPRTLLRQLLELDLQFS